MRESGVESRLARWFLVAWVPSTYAATVTVGNGQLGVHVLPALLSSILIARLVVFAGWCSSLLSARLLTAPPPWDLAFRAGQTVVWAAVLVALGALASRPVPDSGGEEGRT